MKKRLLAVVTACSMMLGASGLLPGAVSAANYGAETVYYNLEDKTAGALFHGGALVNYDKTVTFAQNDLSKLPDGGNISVKLSNPADGSKYKEYGCIAHFGNNWAAPFGDSRITFDLYRRTTDIPFQVNQKGYTLETGGQGNWNPGGLKEPVLFDAGGKLIVFGTDTGKTYEPGLYRIQIDYLRSQNKAVVTLISGKLDGQQVQNVVLGEQEMDPAKHFSAFFQLYLTQNPGGRTTTGTAEDWFDNLKREALPNIWTAAEFSKMDGTTFAPAGTQTLHFTTGRFVDTDTMDGFSITKGGQPMSSRDYAVDYTKCTFAEADMFGCDPVITFTNPLAAGTYTLDFAGVLDTYGQAIPNISFTVLSEEDSAEIQSVGGEFGLNGGSVTNMRKGTKVSNLLANLTVAEGAQKTVLKNGAELSADTYLFGCEEVKITSKSGKYSKTYSLQARADDYSYDFDDAKLASELAPEDIPNDANRAGNPAKTLNKAFPSGGFGQFFASKPASGQAQITGAEFAGKPGRSGQIALIDYVGSAATISFAKSALSQTDAAKQYAVNVSVRPAAGENTRVQIMAGNHNSSTVLGKIAFEDYANEIRADGTETVLEKSSMDDWYTVSFYVTYDDSAKSYTVKNFINGQYVGDKVTAGEFVSGLALRFEQYNMEKTEPCTAYSYFDDISIYECAPLEGNVLPNGFDFVPQVTSDTVVFENTAGKITVPWMTAGELLGAFDLPDGVTAEIQKADGTVAGAEENVTDGMRLVFKNGAVWKTYTIDSANFSYRSDTKTASLALPEGLQTEGTCIFAVYKDGVLEHAQVQTVPSEEPFTYTVGEAEDVGAYSFEAFLFDDMKSLQPLLSNAEFQVN